MSSAPITAKRLPLSNQSLLGERYSLMSWLLISNVLNKLTAVFGKCLRSFKNISEQRACCNFMETTVGQM